MSKDIDHGLLLQNLLERYGARYTTRSGWQPIQCIAPNHQDSHKSASINLIKGAYRCHACDLVGDAIKVLRGLEGLGFLDALTALGGTASGSRASRVAGEERLMELPHKVWI